MHVTSMQHRRAPTWIMYFLDTKFIVHLKSYSYIACNIAFPNNTVTMTAVLEYLNMAALEYFNIDVYTVHKI